MPSHRMLQGALMGTLTNAVMGVTVVVHRALVSLRVSIVLGEVVVGCLIAIVSTSGVALTLDELSRGDGRDHGHEHACFESLEGGVEARHERSSIDLPA